MRQDGPFIEAGENDNLIVQRLDADPNALGIFGYSFLFENQDKIQGVTSAASRRASRPSRRQYGMSGRSSSTSRTPIGG